MASRMDLSVVILSIGRESECLLPTDVPLEASGARTIHPSEMFNGFLEGYSEAALSGTACAPPFPSSSLLPCLYSGTHKSRASAWHQKRWCWISKAEWIAAIT